jgi:hypothetical protein
MKKLLTILSLLLFCLGLKAEYRVFQLRLSKANGDFKEVLSTLDPYQYSSYYPVDPDVSIEYVDSWRCLGDTSNFLNYCKKPDRQPAQSTESGQIINE